MCTVGLKRRKINEREAEDGPFIKKDIEDQSPARYLHGGPDLSRRPCLPLRPEVLL